jgi:DnaK suppressor protein
MTKIELNNFKKILNSRRAELENNGHNRETLAIETSPDELDRIQHAQERDFAMRILDRNARMLREVQAALSRVDAGTFGVCLECEGAIGVKRLAAVPWTASCIVCREAADSLANQPWSGAEQVLAEAA